MPNGYRVEWLGMFENLERARKHFQLLIPTTVALIFLLLWATFQSFRAALLVLAGIPFACIGGILALYVRDMHINVSTGVGFAALFGIAIMDGVLMIRGITVFRQQGAGLADSIVQGRSGVFGPSSSRPSWRSSACCPPPWPPDWAPTCNGPWPR